MNNTYFFMRHGQSTANVRKIIVSFPENGIAHFGLSTLGKKQVISSISKNKDLDKDTIIYASDFKRAKETAEIVHNHINAKNPIVFSTNLRERNFNQLEKTNYSSYFFKVWEFDLLGRSFKDIESVYSIADRFKELIIDLDKKYSRKKILLVSHGDVISVGLTVFNKKDPKYHHKLFFMLENAEIIKVK